MSDPFDPIDSQNTETTTTTDSGPSVGPDFWHNLMNFGLATMSASSTPGMTLGGAIGRGGIAAMESARQNASARATNQELMGRAGYYNANAENAKSESLKNMASVQLMQRQINASQRMNDILDKNYKKNQSGQQTSQASSYDPQQGIDQTSPSQMQADQSAPAQADKQSPTGATWSGSIGDNQPTTTAYRSQNQSVLPKIPRATSAKDIINFYSKIQNAENAPGDPNAVGDGGKATGLMQTHPAAFSEGAAYAGLNNADQKNPAHQMIAGQGYAASMLDKYKGDQVRAALAYNNPSVAESWDGNPNSLPQASKDYIQKVFGGNPLASQTPNGTNQIPNGANQIPNGTNQIPNGVNQIPNGSNQIPNGANQTPDGLNRADIYNASIQGVLGGIPGAADVARSFQPEPGYQYLPDGSYVAIPGGPKDPKIIALQKSTEDYAGGIANQAIDLEKHYTESANNAIETMGALRQMSTLLPHFNPGMYAGWQHAIADFVVSTDPDGSKGLSDEKWKAIASSKTGFDKETSNLAAKLLRQFSARPAQMEFLNFLKNNPNSEMTPGAIRTMIGYMTKESQRDIDANRDFQNYKKQSGGDPNQIVQFPSIWAQTIAKNPDKYSQAPITQTQEQAIAEAKAAIAAGANPRDIKRRMLTLGYDVEGLP